MLPIDWPQNVQKMLDMHTEFQFKLLHRRIPTNDFLAKIGIKDDPRCSFSKEETETVKMFMFSGFVLKQPFFGKEQQQG